MEEIPPPVRAAPRRDAISGDWTRVCAGTDSTVRASAGMGHGHRPGCPFTDDFGRLHQRRLDQSQVPQGGLVARSSAVAESSYFCHPDATIPEAILHRRVYRAFRYLCGFVLGLVPPGYGRGTCVE